MASAQVFVDKRTNRQGKNYIPRSICGGIIIPRFEMTWNQDDYYSHKQHQNYLPLFLSKKIIRQIWTEMRGWMSRKRWQVIDESDDNGLWLIWAGCVCFCHHMVIMSNHGRQKAFFLYSSLWKITIIIVTQMLYSIFSTATFDGKVANDLWKIIYSYDVCVYCTNTLWRELPRR